MGLRVIFTGGSGKAGQRVVRELIKAGHEVLNLDLVKLDDPDVFSCLNTYMRLGEPFPACPPQIPDAVIHFAAMSTPMIVSDGETFRLNVMGTHNVIEAACKLGVKKLVIASSVTTYGVSFGQGHCEFSSFPIHEDSDVNPTDPYALSKVVGERIARSYAARFGIDIYCLRIGRVVEPDEYNDVFENYIYESEKWYAHGWSYVDVRDLCQMCLKALETFGLGYQIFNATNNSITNTTPTAEFLKLHYPHIPILRALDEFEAPMSNKKIQTLLDFKENHDWRQYYTRWRKASPT
ncbi:NAD dependent epimerase/dehydratase [Pyrenochaeta sp. DS3sAY3a]|nr:NAD dependent epimerase/dehydratase [Pyrenochaeta sp. DS3sAY3a]